MLGWALGREQRCCEQNSVSFCSLAPDLLDLAVPFPHPSLHPFFCLFLLPQTLNKNNLIPDDKVSFYPLQQTNVYTTTYYPSPLNKHSLRPEASPGQRCFPNS